jgi:hypothetical protein
VLLETLGILQKSSMPCTIPYPVMNLYSCSTIRIQNGIVSERLIILQITLLNRNIQVKYNIGDK